jgi:hypothetical protein
MAAKPAAGITPTPLTPPEFHILGADAARNDPELRDAVLTRRWPRRVGFYPLCRRRGDHPGEDPTRRLSAAPCAPAPFPCVDSPGRRNVPCGLTGRLAVATGLRAFGHHLVGLRTSATAVNRREAPAEADGALMRQDRDSNLNLFHRDDTKQVRSPRRGVLSDVLRTVRVSKGCPNGPGDVGQRLS